MAATVAVLQYGRRLITKHDPSEAQNLLYVGADLGYNMELWTRIRGINSSYVLAEEAV